MIKILKNWRYDMFPEIENWSDPQEQLKNAKLKDLTFWQWVWFSPIAYIIARLGVPFNFMVWMVIFTVLNVKHGISWALGFPLIATIICIFWIFKIINKIDVYLQMNMYDVLLKDEYKDDK